MTESQIALLVTVGGLLLNAIVLAGSGIWKLTRVETAIRGSIAESRKEVDAELGAQRQRVADDLERVRREFGEVASALRGAIQQMEVYVRDTFVRRESFYKVRDEMMRGIEQLSGEMRTRLDRIDGKIESKL